MSSYKVHKVDPETGSFVLQGSFPSLKRAETYIKGAKAEYGEYDYRIEHPTGEIVTPE